MFVCPISPQFMRNLFTTKCFFNSFQLVFMVKDIFYVLISAFNIAYLKLVPSSYPVPYLVTEGIHDERIYPFNWHEKLQRK